ncbi:hypothetical protein HDV02_006201, partial [Globomyces sp. JEL0801]
FDKRNIDAGQTAVSSESSVSTQKTSTQTADTSLTTTISSSKTPSTTPASTTTPNILSDGTNFIMKYPIILIIIFGFTFVFVGACLKRQRYMKAKKRLETTHFRPSATPLVQEIPIVAPPPSPKNDKTDYRVFVSPQQSSQPTLNNSNGGYSFHSSSDKVSPAPFIRKPMPVHNPQASKLYDVHLSILKKVEGNGGVGQVYRAVYDGKQAVAKIPFDEKHEAMIYEEGKMMSGFDSPYLVKYLAFMADANIQLPGKPMGKHTVLLLEYMNLGSFSKYLVNNSHNKQHATVKSRTLDLFTQSVKGL